ncbi:conserved membrane protein of unknown function [Methylocaldum szegediense]|uniref:Polysaccharide biosynthesis protein n=1 Tax=Methylocaldum szegediense TaxID=73780 RepID=A0ABM9HZF2_9GAMM|nr:conserved membrane protein of unknown function [Methylocaldum szegediense]
MKEKARAYLRAIFRGPLITVSCQGISSLSNFLTGVFVAKSVAAADYGVYSLFYAGLMVLAGLQNSVILEPLRIYGVKTDRKETSAYFYSQFLLQLIFGLVMAGAAMGVLSVMAVASKTLGAFALCLFFLQLSDYFRVVALTELALRRLLVIETTGHAVRIVGLIRLSFDASLTVESALYCMALGGAASSLLAIVLGGHRRSGSGIKNILATGVQNWRFGRWFVLETLAYSSSTYLYFFLVAAIIDRESVGAFNASQTLVNALNVILMGGIGFVIPIARRKLAVEGYEAWRKWLWQSGLTIVGIVSVIAVSLSLFAEPALETLFKPFFAEYGYLVWILSFGYVLRSINSVLRVAFQTAEKPQIGFLSRLLSTIVTIAISYPLLQYYGVAGAAVGIVVTQLIWVTVYLVFIWRGELGFNKLGMEICQSG